MHGQLFGEFFGTLVLVTFGDGVVANLLLNKSKGQGAGWLHVNLGWAMAVTFGVYAAIATGAPQADINPSVTLFKTLAGIYTPGQAVMTMVAQVVGGILGGVLVYLVYLPHWAVTPDADAKLGIFCTGPGIRDTAGNFICEFIATIFLLLGIFTLFSKGVQGDVGSTPGFGPFMVGMLIYVIGAALGGPTGYSMNMARDLGPRIAHAILPIPGKRDADWGYAWIASVAPLCGGAAAFGICRALGLI
jgi:glycerol uptake facilitator protein